MNRSENRRTFALTLGLVLIAAAAGYIAGKSRQKESRAPSAANDTHAVNEAAATVSYTCSMHPEVKQSKPGLCPICNMKLTAAEATDAPTGGASGDRSADGKLVLSAAARARAQVRAMQPRREPNWQEERFIYGEVIAATPSAPGAAALRMYPDDAFAVGNSVIITKDIDTRAGVTATISSIEPAKGYESRRVVATSPQLKSWPVGTSVRAQRISQNSRATLFLPRSAVVYAGRRSLAYVMTPAHGGQTAYEARVIQLGTMTEEGWYPVLSGLAESDMVVMHGAFVIDAEMQLRSLPSLVTAPSDVDLSELRRALSSSEQDKITQRQNTYRGQTGYVDTLVQVPGEHAASMSLLLQSYVQMQKCLAEDDLSGAQQAAKALRDASEKMRPAPESVFGASWYRIARVLEPHAGMVVRAADLEGARHALLPLSQQVVFILRAYGNSSGQVLFLAHCPMANDGAGGDWVQAADKIENPYFGEEMYRCGKLGDKVLPGGYLQGAAVLLEQLAAQRAGVQ